MLCLTACGKKETAPEAIVNWTLPDVASFEENYTSERETAVAEKAEPEAESYRWKPHGVYTYVYGTSGEDGKGADGSPRACHLVAAGFFTSARRKPR